MKTSLLDKEAVKKVDEDLRNGRLKLHVVSEFFAVLGDVGSTGDDKKLQDFSSAAYGTHIICEEAIASILEASDVLRALVAQESSKDEVKS